MLENYDMIDQRILINPQQVFIQSAGNDDDLIKMVSLGPTPFLSNLTKIVASLLYYFTPMQLAQKLNLSIECLDKILTDAPKQLKRRKKIKEIGPCFVCDEVFNRLNKHLKKIHGLTEEAIQEYRILFRNEIGLVCQGGLISLDGKNQYQQDIKQLIKNQPVKNTQISRNNEINTKTICEVCNESVSTRLIKAHLIRHNSSDLALCTICSRYFSSKEINFHYKKFHGMS